MKIVTVSSNYKGGAGICALTNHEQLIQRGYDAHFLTFGEFRSDITNCFSFSDNSEQNLAGRIKKSITYRLGLKKDHRNIYLKNSPPGFEYFSFPFSEVRIHENDLVKNADIIHLHWVSGFIDFKSFFKYGAESKKKIIWTLHDMNPFTGGCHHSDACMKFTNECYKCPQLYGTINDDIAGELLNKKHKWLSGIDDDQLQIVTPSKWLYDLSKQSRLLKRFRHHIIHNGINNMIYKWKDKEDLKMKWNIIMSEKVILFMAQDINNQRKGMHLLEKSLQKLQVNEKLVIITVGKCEISFNLKSCRVLNLGYVNDPVKISEIYNIADVFVLPSIAENFPNTICEALLCGTPVVAFSVGGIPEQIDDQNGYLVKPYDIDDLAYGIDFVLANKDRYDTKLISEKAARKYSSSKITNAYIDIYHEMLCSG